MVLDERLPTLTDIPDERGRRADDQAMTGHIPCHQRAGADHGEPTNRYIGQNNGPGSDGSAIANADVPLFPVFVTLQRTIGCDGAGALVVGQAHIGANENPVLDHDAMIDRGVVLNFHHVANRDVEIDLDALAKDAIDPDVRAFPHLRLMPDARAFADSRLGR